MLYSVAISRHQYSHRAVITGDRGGDTTSWMKLLFHLLFQKLLLMFSDLLSNVYLFRHQQQPFRRSVMVRTVIGLG